MQGIPTLFGDNRNHEQNPDGACDDHLAGHFSRKPLNGQSVKRYPLSTLTVMEAAAGTKHIPDKTTMRQLYGRLRSLDDGLPPIEKTRLLSPDLWPNA